MYELNLPGTPPSINASGVGASSGWQRFHRLKQKWEGMIYIALLEAKVPKGLNSVTASAQLTFPTRRRRDEGNFRALLEKALGDTLQLGWIPDDTPRYYRFNEVTFEAEKGDATTVIRLEEVDQCLCDDPVVPACPLHSYA